MNTNKASDIADYIVRTLHAAGENIGLQRLQNLVFMVNGYTLAKYGQGAFTEAFEVTPSGPNLPSLLCAYKHFEGSITPQHREMNRPQVDFWGTPVGNEGYQATDLPAELQAIVKSVLRRYNNAFSLHEWITTSQLWQHSYTTERKVDPANVLAFFRQLTPLETAGEPQPTVDNWPVIFQEVNMGEMNHQAWRDACRQQDEDAEQQLERTQQPVKRRTIAELLGKKA